MSTSSRRNMIILMFSLIVVMLGFGMVIPIFPFYLERMGAGGSEFGLLIAMYAVMQLVFGPLWGSISDRIGRKPVLLIGMLGQRADAHSLRAGDPALDALRGTCALRPALISDRAGRHSLRQRLHG